jgi:hypothetical protein
MHQMSQPETTPLFDVIAVNLKTQAYRFMATRQTQANAEAVMNMAIARRGVEFDFYKIVPHGSESDVAA